MSDFQHRVRQWSNHTFDETVVKSTLECIERFMEGAIELAQAIGLDETVLTQLVAHTYKRHEGEVPQEIGGVLVCLAVLCDVLHYDMDQCRENELARAWTKVEAIREKQKTKPKFYCQSPRQVEHSVRFDTIDEIRASIAHQKFDLANDNSTRRFVLCRMDMEQLDTIERFLKSFRF